MLSMKELISRLPLQPGDASVLAPVLVLLLHWLVCHHTVLAMAASVSFWLTATLLINIQEWHHTVHDRATSPEFRVYDDQPSGQQQDFVRHELRLVGPSNASIKT